MNFKSGYVTILGRPNVGKSTFLNRVLKYKISIVSPRPQTTRRRVVGIHSEDDFQIVFLDTPGILDPRYALQSKMMEYVRTSIADADLLLWLVDCGERKSDFNLEKKFFSKNRNPLIIGLNKIDLIPKEKLLPLIESLHKEFDTEAIVPFSATQGDGVEELMDEVLSRLPLGSPFYPVDQISEQPEKFFAAELIRERVFFQFREEVPYSVEVEIEEFTERRGRKDFIRAIIYVERNSQKGIIIGKKGEALKQLGATARKEIELFLGRPVYLELFVRIMEKWRRESSKLKRLGY